MIAGCSTPRGRAARIASADASRAAPVNRSRDEDNSTITRLNDHRNFRKLAEGQATSAYWHPLVEKDLEGAPHCHPSDDEHAFADDAKSRSTAERNATCRASTQLNRNAMPVASAMRPSRNNNRSRRRSLVSRRQNSCEWPRRDRRPRSVGRTARWITNRSGC